MSTSMHTPQLSCCLLHALNFPKDFPLLTKMAPKSERRPRALVTGASSGIGAEFAKHMARDGYDLILVARRRERLEELARQLQTDHSIAAEVLVADLTQPSDLRLVEQRLAEDSALEMLVNNAGFGGYMPFIDLDPDRAEELIRLHVLAVTRLTHAALSGMVPRSHGTIINVSSLLAFSQTLPSPPLPKRATYAATKAYIHAFTQILHSELQGTGVQVQVLCPALVWTEFHAKVNLDTSFIAPDMRLNPEEVVNASLKGLELGEVVCIPALNDPAILTEFEERQRLVGFHGMSVNGLAQRYQPAPVLTE